MKTFFILLCNELFKLIFWSYISWNSPHFNHSQQLVFVCCCDVLYIHPTVLFWVDAFFYLQILGSNFQHNLGVGSNDNSCVVTFKCCINWCDLKQTKLIFFFSSPFGRCMFLTVLFYYHYYPFINLASPDQHNTLGGMLGLFGCKFHFLTINQLLPFGLTFFHSFSLSSKLPSLI